MSRRCSAIITGILGLQCGALACFAGDLIGPRRTLLSAQNSIPALDFNFAGGYYYQTNFAGSNVPANYLTTTRASVGLAANTDGLWSSFSSNTPRITNAGILIEEARTNNAIQNQALNNAAWTSVLVNATYSQTDPAGGTTAALLVPNGTNAAHQTFNTTGLTLTAAQYTWSVFFKPNGYNFAYVDATNTGGTNRFTAVVNLTTGAVTQTTNTGSPTSTATQVFVYSNGWTRVCVSMDATVSAAFDFIDFGASPTGTPTIVGGAASFAGNSSSGVFASWPQIELGLGCTSPILTATTAVTRAADFVIAAHSPTFGLNGLTMSATAIPNMPNAYGTTQTPLQIDEGDNNQRIDIDRGSGSGALGGGITSNGMAWGAPGTIIWNTGVKVATAYALATNDQAMVSNGFLSTYVGPAQMFAPSRIVIGANGNGQHQFDGTIQRIAVWPTVRRPDSSLRAIAVSP